MLHFDPNLISIGHLVAEIIEQFCHKNNIKHKYSSTILACNSKINIPDIRLIPLDHVTFFKTFSEHKIYVRHKNGPVCGTFFVGNGTHVQGFCVKSNPLEWHIPVYFNMKSPPPFKE